jgi:hypothetical protein
VYSIFVFIWLFAGKDEIKEQSNVVNIARIQSSMVENREQAAFLSRLSILADAPGVPGQLSRAL